ncbi:hypothetical protein ACFL3B_00565 [Gemmatimonadota bacterium]
MDWRLYTSGHDSNPEGPYLGQTPPGNTPEIFAPGIISTGMNEVEAAFSPDGTELYKTLDPNKTYGTLQRELNQPGNGSWDIRWVDVSVVEDLRPGG